MKKALGLIINPLAGVGGSVALKGSDGAEIQRLAIELGAIKKSGMRARVALEAVQPLRDEFVVYAAPGEMGADFAIEMGFETIVIGEIGTITEAKDTINCAKLMNDIPVDVLLFAGGDGTARNVCSAVDKSLPVVGVPTGVKIHSAVYATSPAAAGKALYACLSSTVATKQAEVMDIDEEQYRAGHLQAKLYGYMTVPIIRGLMQNPKAASHNNANDVNGICEEIKDRISASNPDDCFIFGAGSTVAAIEKHLGLKGTLIGIDVMRNGVLIAEDATEKELIEITKTNNCHLIVTAIGGQGHIFGRGNQQLSSDVIRQIGLDNIWVVATGSKIYELPNQQLYVDTGDDELNRELRGYRRVIIGWQENLICQVN